jgi:hypothetical protein
MAVWPTDIALLNLDANLPAALTHSRAQLCIRSYMGPLHLSLLATLSRLVLHETVALVLYGGWQAACRLDFEDEQ